MNLSTIKRLQKENGFADLQRQINDGSIWRSESSVGREAMRHLESGACMLPKIITRDYYGNHLPARQMLKAGTKGTFKNSVRFWENFNPEES